MPRDLATLLAFNPGVVMNLSVDCGNKRCTGDSEEGTPYMKGALVARAELLELPNPGPSEALYKDNNFLCVKMHRAQFSSFFKIENKRNCILIR